ncbi:MAG: hypothetical protein FWC72_03585 [Oscillospiraceae bacterium]|nr:hypothetical protein [Oscillospiraceae bacterium]
MDVIRIIQLFIPVITFAMGYFLTNIGYKRDRKLGIIREKFEKLYHPFYLLLYELGTDTEDGEGLELGTEGAGGYSALKPFFEHLTANVYLASPEGQKRFAEARKLFVGCCRVNDQETEEQFGESFNGLCEYLLLEYVKAGKALGYDLDAEGHTA